MSHFPTEMHDLAADPARAAAIELWRGRLVRELANRPEGFTDGTKLLRLNSAVRNS